MTSSERSIQPISVTTHMVPGNSAGGITVSYAWHPDTKEVIVVVAQGIGRRGGDFTPIPESQWRTLDFDDESLVDALFTETDLRDIRKLIQEKDSPSTNALLQYIHKTVGEALSD